MVKVVGDLGCWLYHPSKSVLCSLLLTPLFPSTLSWWQTGRCWIRDEVVGKPVRRLFWWTRHEMRRDDELLNLTFSHDLSGHCSQSPVRLSFVHIDISQCLAMVSILTLHDHMGDARHSPPWLLSSILNSHFHPDWSLLIKIHLKILTHKSHPF